MSNATGSYLESTADTMRFYDAAPPALRETYRNCIFDFATGPGLRRSRQGWTVAELKEDLICKDVANVRKEAGIRWGRQADAYLAAQRRCRRRDYLDTLPRRAFDKESGAIHHSPRLKQRSLS